jgi:hypothetical protein
LITDLKDCELKPYVSYRTKEIYQEALTPKDLFNAVYGHKMLKDFKAGKLDENGKSMEPSEEEKLTPEEAWYASYPMKLLVTLLSQSIFFFSFRYLSHPNWIDLKKGIKLHEKLNLKQICDKTPRLCG